MIAFYRHELNFALIEPQLRVMKKINSGYSLQFLIWKLFDRVPISNRCRKHISWEIMHWGYACLTVVIELTSVSILKGTPFAWWKPIITSKAIPCRFGEQYDNWSKRTIDDIADIPVTLIKPSNINLLFSSASYTNVRGIIPCFLGPLRPAFVLRWSGLPSDRWIQLSSIIELVVQSRYKPATCNLVPVVHYFPS